MKIHEIARMFKERIPVVVDNGKKSFQCYLILQKKDGPLFDKERVYYSYLVGKNMKDKCGLIIGGGEEYAHDDEGHWFLTGVDCDDHFSETLYSCCSTDYFPVKSIRISIPCHELLELVHED